MSFCVPIIPANRRLRNCNFSFYYGGIIKWHEYLMQLNVKYAMCEYEWMRECVFNGFIWLPTWHTQLLTVDAVPSQQPNHAHPIMEPQLRLPRLKSLVGTNTAPLLPFENKTHSSTFKQYNIDCGWASPCIILIDRCQKGVAKMLQGCYWI